MIESVPVFIGLTLLFMGGCAVMAGQALAATWRPLWQVLPYALLLGLADRFLAFALFGGTLASLPAWAFDSAVLAALAGGSFRLTRARRMVAQYPWLYERDGWFGWRDKGERGSST
ncbi:DUF6867 family protein [Magnetospirillum sp. UT-4]|uniref:DUF6867 family protein n=1 Tax=Magnetospirillum sp. UT-4 TaxID=2681467 RepID=UPI001384AA43|nr:hypothetical protein [Magnetospirillum sp. UT-4]CAA7625410.1 conserved exported hypothetical protein [Magnetospirillum sp. UT-4]